MTVCVRDFHALCPRLSPRGNFGESRRNRIWPYTDFAHMNSLKLNVKFLCPHF